MKTMNYYTNKIIEISFTPLLSFSRKRESRRRLRESWELKSWIPCQARNDRREHICTNKKGFTIIELVITMVLIGIIAYIVATALSTGITAYFTTDFRKEALDQTRIAMERMTREIRNLRDSDDVATGTSSQFNFTDVSGTNIDFSYSNPNITRDGATLATNITSFSFSYIRADGASNPTFVDSDPDDPAIDTKRIRITFTATISGETVTLQSEVWPRSL
ncbi:MAG: type II secretion system protein [Nitrospirae bacterium]|nr:type II secretion system protein [Nitrospirota bacterium]